MKKKGKHLIFYDGGCAFCNKIVHFVLLIDKKHQFLFAPLDGEIGSKKLPKRFFKENTMALIENYGTGKELLWIRGQGAFRILWLVGGKWSFLGGLYLFPFLVNPLYRFIAKHRHRIGKKFKFEDFTKHKNRFLN